MNEWFLNNKYLYVLCDFHFQRERKTSCRTFQFGTFAGKRWAWNSTQFGNLKTKISYFYWSVTKIFCNRVSPAISNIKRRVDRTDETKRSSTWTISLEIKTCRTQNISTTPCPPVQQKQQHFWKLSEKQLFCFLESLPTFHIDQG